MNKPTHNPLSLFSEGAATLSMSSIEIADLTEKNHGHVIRDIKALLVTLYAPGSSFEDLEKDDPVLVHLGKSATWERDSRGYVTVIHLDRDHTLTLIAGYDAKLRMRIIKRWADLEAGATSTDAMMRALNDPNAMRGLLLTYSEKVISLEAANAEMAPKVEALDRIAEHYGSHCRTNAAKILGIAPQELIRWLRTNGWTYRRLGDSDDIAYQSKINAGLLEHKINSGIKADGTEWTSTQVRVTAKGVTVLAQAFPPAAKKVP